MKIYINSLFVKEVPDSNKIWGPVIETLANLPEYKIENVKDIQKVTDGINIIIT